MASLAPGILQKLMEGMKTGVKPTGEHRSSLLQVTDIVPIDLDDKNLLPKQGFFIKISDSSHSIYATLPSDQDDVVLSDKIQLGQLIYVDRLDPGTPVPIIRGVKPIPGRHPLFLGTPETLESSCLRSRQRRRGSWGQNNCEFSTPFTVLKPSPLDFDHCTTTPAKHGLGAAAASPASTRGRFNGGVRCSYGGGGGGGLLKGGESPAMMRKSCVVPPSSKFPRSKSVCDREKTAKKISVSSVLLSHFKSSAKKSDSPPRSCVRTRRAIAAESERDALKPISKIASPKQRESKPNKTEKLEKSWSLPGRLSSLSKEAMQQRETAQKIALQALREATAMETVVLHLKTLANLSKSSKADCPASSFEKFLEFHRQISETMGEIASIEAAATDNKSEEGASSSSILHEIQHNSIVDHEKTASKRRATSTTTTTTTSLKHKQLRPNDENKNPTVASPPSVVGNTERLVKEIEKEAANWFMEFIETTLEKGMKKCKGKGDDADVKKVPQSLILQVINWVEAAEQSADNTKRQVHPKASHITRKLRIKLKNP